MPDNSDIFNRPHGGDIYSAAGLQGLSPDEVIDFSANINPLGPPDGIGSCLAKNLWKISHYPAPGSPGLIKSAAKHFRIEPGMILAANGATELLDAAARAFARKTALIPAPAYAGYAESAARNNLNIKYILPRIGEEEIFPGLDETARHINEQIIVFLGRPGNPTGHLPDPEKLKTVISENPGAFFVIDESFLDFTPQKSLAGSGLPNLLVVYSMTKFYALPGLRLGLGLGPPEVIRKISSFISPWSVNVFAQEAGRLCLEDKKFQNTSRTNMARLKTAFVEKLRQVSWLEVFPGEANFVLCRIRDQRFTARGLAGKLMSRGMLIRPADNFPGLDHSWFRLAVKSENHNDLLCRILFRAGSKSTPARPAPGKKKTPALMILGTCSGAGKSLISAGLCRILHQDGIDVVPFKSQNMSLNSYVTAEGLEMGRAQVVQARACRLEPDARMNPVLLKPNSDTGSQVIVLGRPVGNMDVDGYIKFKQKLFDQVKSTYDQLASEHEAVILEGAGSPAEINLKQHDLVNMNMARHAGAKALLVGDIDRGGVFASFAGTMELLLDWEKDLVAGFLINRFRGQQDLLQSAIDYTRMVTGQNVLGVVPFVHNLGLPEEDSVSFKNRRNKKKIFRPDQVNIGIIDLPHISNFTDFDPLYPEPDVNIVIIRDQKDFDHSLDVLILPGSKNVPSDLRALRSAGLDSTILDFAGKPGREVLGICGGLQMLGLCIHDSLGLESGEKITSGLGLLPLETGIMAEKTLKQVDTFWTDEDIIPIRGYEIHHGQTRILGRLKETVRGTDGSPLAVSHPDLSVWATYIHGIFDSDPFRRKWLDKARQRKGLHPLKEIQTFYDIDAALDRLAGTVRENIDLKAIYRILGI
jgi:adenosylcobyric acid synthase